MSTYEVNENEEEIPVCFYQFNRKVARINYVYTVKVEAQRMYLKFIISENLDESIYNSTIMS